MMINDPFLTLSCLSFLSVSCFGYSLWISPLGYLLLRYDVMFVSMASCFEFLMLKDGCDGCNESCLCLSF